MVYFIHYKQGLWYQSVTPRKPKAETFPGLTPRWVSNPMHIVSKVEQPLHYIIKFYSCFKSKVCTVVIHSIYRQNETDLHVLRLLIKRNLRVPVLTLTWEHKRFENQHKAGEFISGFCLWTWFEFPFRFWNVVCTKKFHIFLIVSYWFTNERYDKFVHWKHVYSCENV